MTPLARIGAEELLLSAQACANVLATALAEDEMRSEHERIDLCNVAYAISHLVEVAMEKLAAEGAA